mgnify:CR=1 FL=1
MTKTPGDRGGKTKAPTAPARDLRAAADALAPEDGTPPSGPKKPRAYSIADEAYPDGSTVITDDFNDGNPFNESDWRVIWNAWAGFVLRIVLIAAAFFSVMQYLAAREEARVGRTLDLVELWERSEYQDAQDALKKRLTGLNQKYANLLGKNPSDSEVAIFRDRVGQAAMTAEGGDIPVDEFQRHFDRIVYFLNRLSFCVEERLCSRRVADAYFRDFALSFWSYFSGYVAEERKAGSVTYAMPIEQYLGIQPATKAGN